MNNQNLLNLFGSLFGLNSENNINEQNNQLPNNQNNAYNITQYPTTIYTKPTNNMNSNSYTSAQNNSPFSNLFGSDALKNLLPLILGKSGGSNISELTSKISGGNLSQIFSSLNKPQKEEKKQEEKSVIDLSEYTEIK